MSVLDAAVRAVTDVHDAGGRVALVGGLAVSARAEPRNTRDVDLAVRVADDADAEAIVRALAAHRYGIVAVVEQDATARLATVRMRSPNATGVLVDLLFASSGIEADVVSEAESIAISPGLALPVARTGHLIAMKLLARDDDRRPQDRVDLAALISTAPPAELERAREACAAITTRGYARGRDLATALDSAIAKWAGGMP